MNLWREFNNYFPHCVSLLYALPFTRETSLKSLGDQLQEGISAVSLSCWAPRAGKAHPVLGWPSWVRRCPL